MTSPINQLPIDPAMVRRVDEMAATLAKDTGHMVLVVAIKEGGKMHITLDGEPETGHLAELAKNPPALLRALALAIQLSEAFDRTEPKQ